RLHRVLREVVPVPALRERGDPLAQDLIAVGRPRMGEPVAVVGLGNGRGHITPLSTRESLPQPHVDFLLIRSCICSHPRILITSPPSQRAFSCPRNPAAPSPGRRWGSP